jgi:hypothetical protein
MACLTYCGSCRKETLHGQGGCLTCLDKKIRESKIAFLETRAKMTTEDRIALLESDWFDHNENHPQREMRFA